MLRFETAAPEKMAEIISLANEAFLKNNCTASFAQILPKLYSKQVNSHSLHTLLYEDNSLAGLYCAQITNFNYAGAPLRAGFIGTVCVKNEYRGKGYLSALMQNAVQKLKSNGCDIGVLGGQRQRYERFGFTPCGMHHIFELNIKNVSKNKNGAVLQPLENDTAYERAAHALYMQGCVTTMRSTNFINILKSWNSEPYAIVADNQFVGYCTVSKEFTPYMVTELAVLTPEHLPTAATLLCEKYGDINLQIMPWQQNELSYFSKIAEQSFITTNHSFKVYNYVNTANATLSLLKQLSSKTDTDVNISVQGVGVLSVSNNGCTLNTINNSEGITQLDATRLLFSYNSSFVSSEINAYNLPLPLAFLWADGI